MWKKRQGVFRELDSMEKTERMNDSSFGTESIPLVRAESHSMRVKMKRLSVLTTEAEKSSQLGIETGKNFQLSLISAPRYSYTRVLEKRESDLGPIGVRRGFRLSRCSKELSLSKRTHCRHSLCLGETAMDSISKQITRASRRLTTQIWLESFTKTAVVLLSVAVIALAIPKLWHLAVDFQTWAVAWIASAVGLAFLVATIVTWLKRPTQLASAIEIDRRFNLRERLSSSLQLSDVDRQSHAGSALTSDAESTASKIDVRDQFQWGFRPSLMWPCIPACLLVAAFFIPNAEPREIAENGSNRPLSVTQVKNSTKPLIERIKKSREFAEKLGLEETAEEFKRMQSELEKLQRETGVDRKEAMSKMNAIKKRMEEQRASLGTGNELKKSLEKMKSFDAGPGEKMAKALQEGDFEQASEEVEKMLDDLREGRLDEEQKKMLDGQMEALKKAIEEAVAEHEMAKSQLADQIEQAQRAGDPQKAAQLQKQLDELKAANSQMSDLGNTLEQLSAIQEAMASGDTEMAAQALEDLADQLQQMQSELDQLENIEELMDQLNAAKNSMNESGQAASGNGIQQDANQMGNGMSDGAGEGNRPESESDIDFFDSQVRAKVQAGETIFQGKVNGKNRKGITREEVRESILTSEAEDADSLESVNLPRAERDQAKDYFNAMRDGG